MSESAPPQKRRFLPEPVETTTRSNRKPVENTRQQPASSSSEKDFAQPEEDEPMTYPTNIPRRLKPQPVETSARSRKHSVEPIETTSRSNRNVYGKEETQHLESTQPGTPRRRFLPLPVETSFGSNRQEPALELTPESSPKSTNSSPIDPKRPVEREAKPRRRFTPDLIETSKRSKRQGDNKPATLPTDKTDITPGTNHIYQPRKLIKNKPLTIAPPKNTPTQELTGSLFPYHPVRQGSMRPHNNTRRSTRQNSFTPSLQPILSSNDNSDETDEEEEEEEEEEQEDMPSLSESYSSSHDSIMKSQLARTRESCDDRFSGYLLELAAKAAEKQLREQALLEAFPNSDYHEVVEHFYDREVEPGSEDDDTISIGLLPHEILERRKSTELSWAAKEMQQHQESLARQREEETLRKLAAQATDPAFKDPFWENGVTEKRLAGAVNGLKEEEMEKMRNAASPPMQGADLHFRMCPSPKQTILASDQEVTLKLHRDSNGGGLWGGYCVRESESDKEREKEKDGQHDPWILKAQRQEMIHTPSVEQSNPFDAMFALPSGGSASPAARPHSRHHSRNGSGIRLVAGIDERLAASVEAARAAGESALKAEEKLMREREIEAEFTDEFITQVYNYLSLGYPSLGRQYDEELSRIAKIPEEELRKDDRHADAKGYIGIIAGINPKGPLGNGTNGLGRMGEDKAPGRQGIDGKVNTSDEKVSSVVGIKGSDPRHCSRWVALKAYIVEWARQNPDLGDSEAPKAWGVRARRGSWAI